MGRTQRGNNNAYCQDNELAWVDWSTIDHALLDFTRAAIALRREHPVFRQRSFFTGTGLHSDGVKDVAWFSADGEEMTPSDWYDLHTRTIGMYLSGREIRDAGAHNEPILDDSFLVILHAGLDTTTFTLPGAPWATGYEVVLDSTSEHPPAQHDGARIEAAVALDVPAVAFIVLRATTQGRRTGRGAGAERGRAQRRSPVTMPSSAAGTAISPSSPEVASSGSVGRTRTL
jgi:isoamylase